MTFQLGSRSKGHNIRALVLVLFFWVHAQKKKPTPQQNRKLPRNSRNFPYSILKTQTKRPFCTKLEFPHYKTQLLTECLEILDGHTTLKLYTQKKNYQRLALNPRNQQMIADEKFFRAEQTVRQRTFTN